jgi:ankyrin repeat protein
MHEGIDPNERDFRGRTPLFLAAMEGSCEVILRLLEIDSVDPDARDHGGKTPFYWAILHGQHAAALFLRDSGGVNTSIMTRPLEV